MSFAISHARRVSAPIALGAPILVALLTLYCQLIGIEDGVPLGVSLRWALVTALTWAVFGLSVWHARHRIAERIAAGTARDLLALAAAMFLLALMLGIGSGIATAAWSGSAFGPLDLFNRIIRLAPVLGAVALAGTSALAAWRWRHETQVPASPQELLERKPDGPVWLDFPEDPRLRLRTDEIALVRTARNYCELRVGGRDYCVRVTAKALEKRLAPIGFVRVHRSAIVNLARVRATSRTRSGRVRLILDDGSELYASRSYRSRLQQVLS